MDTDLMEYKFARWKREWLELRRLRSDCNTFVKCQECGKETDQLTEDEICKTCWNRGYDQGKLTVKLNGAK